MAKVSENIVNALKNAGIKHIFGIPSIHNIGFYDALRQESSIKHILCRHESSATHMADGYARASGNASVVISSTGPGAGYMLAPLIEAWWNCSPVIAMTSNIKADRIGQGTGVLHEFDDQDVAFKTITKKTFAARSADEASGNINEALSIARSGRPGPVYLETPVDLWDVEVEAGAEIPLDIPPPINESDIEKACQILSESKSPVIICGTEAVRDVMDDQVLALAEKLSAPVLTVANAKGIIPENHDLAFGNVSRRGVVREIVQAADATLVIGSRLRNVDFGRRGVDLNRLIHVAPDEKWVNNNFQAECALIGNMPAICGRLLPGIDEGSNGPDRKDRAAGLIARKNEEMAEISAKEKAVQYLDVIRSIMPDDSYLSVDNTLLGYWSEYFYPSYKSGSLVTAKGSSIIGFSFPAAIGVKLAQPDKHVAAIVGDGGFLYGAHELATCVRHNIGFPVIVVNDGRFGIIDFLQKMSYGEGFETKLSNPDLVAFANSFGVNAVSTDSPDGLKTALEEAFSSGEMRLIELKASFPTTPFAIY